MSSSRATRDIALVAVFAALIIAFAFVAIPTGVLAVPIVLQNAIVILTGLILGARRGTLATLLFLLVGLLGLPVMAGGRALLPALTGPTVGYIVGYVFSAAIAGWCAYRVGTAGRPRLAWLGIGGFLALVTQYACGVVGLMLVAHLSAKAALVAQIPFLLPDALKVAAMVAIAAAVHAALPDLRTSK